MGMCEVYKQAPASVTCDSNIHSINPLTRRHKRVLMEPFFDSTESVIKSGSLLTDLLVVPTDHKKSPKAGSWILPNQNFVEDPDVKPADLLFTPKLELRGGSISLV